LFIDDILLADGTFKREFSKGENQIEPLESKN